jgi:hypothetical protein
MSLLPFRESGTAQSGRGAADAGSAQLWGTELSLIAQVLCTILADQHVRFMADITDRWNAAAVFLRGVPPDHSWPQTFSRSASVRAWIEKIAQVGLPARGRRQFHSSSRTRRGTATRIASFCSTFSLLLFFRGVGKNRLNLDAPPEPRIQEMPSDGTYCHWLGLGAMQTD